MVIAISVGHNLVVQDSGTTNELLFRHLGSYSNNHLVSYSNSHLVTYSNNTHVSA
jgi:hypothetical protein